MKLIFILALSATVSAQNYGWFCNGGTGGNGGCEANGQATYCRTICRDSILHDEPPLLLGTPKGASIAVLGMGD
ncbi:hypothetical protein HYFRA_00010586 [Hymenoscyphus fraxineus]|uniref:Uncharacterized protein n=1 Tax=Hymenoscyphus fraxineus TaxID=746836 RepID=A0A9N9L8N9_9HELO|nr:hypothetical protein HYFRA_00010586 [Hymenoscyphus fraxineus]